MEGKKTKKNWNFGEVDVENRDGGFCILSFSLLFLVAKFSNPIWPGPLFHVKQHFWIIFFLLSVFLFNVSRETIVNWNNVSLWIGRWWYEFVIRLFVCVYNLWVALFWDFGVYGPGETFFYFLLQWENLKIQIFCWECRWCYFIMLDGWIMCFGIECLSWRH